MLGFTKNKRAVLHYVPATKLIKKLPRERLAVVCHHVALLDFPVAHKGYWTLRGEVNVNALHEKMREIDEKYSIRTPSLIEVCIGHSRWYYGWHMADLLPEELVSCLREYMSPKRNYLTLDDGELHRRERGLMVAAAIEALEYAVSHCYTYSCGENLLQYLQLYNRRGIPEHASRVIQTMPLGDFLEVRPSGDVWWELPGGRKKFLSALVARLEHLY